MLGWDAGSWGFHSDDGCLYEDGKQSWKGILYSDPYTGGEVIGCGVNFAENTAFYTRGGKVVGDTVTEAKIIGRAFQDIRGKLYPAVSMDITQEGWEITAVFPGKDGTSPDFIFQGDLESSETLAPPVKKDDSSTSDDADSGSEIVVIED
ncbi:uncharacterized protein LY89DRAFT_110786 [Mollisia scopiformis]|uniref:B30.2/SPRY domain-containing protein n=1 Tax=Mollisia scopiformis TaxID=149040 RepID=A0A194X5A0_MOLSC|nr:uncharacterized protein LY89DRAFT_110786 [Mollisia scopiformis]KUJ15363.1 hypothetical protein LY89DRAFT_110786 [Mollisia scopiformis]